MVRRYDSGRMPSERSRAFFEVRRLHGPVVCMRDTLKMPRDYFHHGGYNGSNAAVY